MKLKVCYEWVQQRQALSSGQLHFLIIQLHASAFQDVAPNNRQRRHITKSANRTRTVSQSSSDSQHAIREMLANAISLKIPHFTKGMSQTHQHSRRVNQCTCKLAKKEWFAYRDQDVKLHRLVQTSKTSPFLLKISNLRPKRNSHGADRRAPIPACEFQLAMTICSKVTDLIDPLDIHQFILAVL